METAPTSPTNDAPSPPPGRIVFVTGRLAAPLLTETVGPLAERGGFPFEIVTAKISVAALMTAEWLVGKLRVPPDTAKVVLPGLCKGNLDALRDALGGLPVERGPADLVDLPDYFGQRRDAVVDYGAYQLQILAEINHADRLTPASLMERAARHQADGADVIDLGCTPGEPWSGVTAAVRDLRSAGLRVSIDSFDADEVAAATAAGAELVLSVNEGNVERAKEWHGAEVVAIPDRWDEPDWFDRYRRLVDRLEADGVRYRLDPIVEPIGFGFAASLGRYLQTRDAFPDAAMMMGVGNLTELTEVDSAGVNAVLAGFCEELAIGSVLTTEVANWARGSVKELDVARRLMHHAVRRRRVPKHVDSRLAMLRDPKVVERGADALRRLQAGLSDANFRLFADGGELVALNAEIYEHDVDPFALFERLGVTDAGHAFYLGWELMKAATALQLGKRYVQDQALSWGFLTKAETSHRETKRRGAERRKRHGET
ncbi:MAG: DUF6513 domain-containing protein [Planctomycetia bacterium]